MITLKTILVATDFSDSAEAALERACALATAFNASLHLLHVVTEPLNEAWSGFVPPKCFMDTVERLQGEARQRLEQLAPPGTDVTVATTWGNASDQVLKYARTHDADLIVCGTHGRRGWDRIAMGSVAERVVRLASCPVLTVHAANDIASAA
jgi:nucleotide-binding universal stress UspA family protein